MSAQMIGSALELEPNQAHRSRLIDSLRFRRQVEDPRWVDGPRHVITGGRQEGKTRLAVKWLLESERHILVTVSESAAREVRDRAGIRWRDRHRVISFRRLIETGPVRGFTYGVDEASEILSRLLGLSREQLELLTVCTAAPWQSVSGEPAANPDTSDAFTAVDVF